MAQTPLAVSRTAVVRFLLNCQELFVESSRADTPDAVLAALRRLECVQIDPVAAVERNQHLALGARLAGYRPAMLGTLLAQGRVFEYVANAACVIPVEDYPMFAGTRRRRAAGLAVGLSALAPVVDDIRATLKAHGPQPARQFVSEHRVHGYWDTTHATTKATSHALNMMLDAGEVMVVRRDGNTRYFDLPERVLPAALYDAAQRIATPDADDALLDKYLRAYRVFDAGDPRFGWRAMPVRERRAEIERRVRAGTIVPLAIPGLARAYWVLATDVDRLMSFASPRQRATTEPVRFLPPLDNLVWRRPRLADLFGFDYTWEVYQPESKRRYGYYAMPILAGDRLIGRLDPRLDRARGRLNVRLLQIEPDVRVTARLRSSVERALAAFAHWHGVDDVRIRRTMPVGLLAGFAVRRRVRLSG